MSKILSTFTLHAGSLESRLNQNSMSAPTVTLTIGYHKRNQKKLRRMRRQGLKV